MNNHVPAHEHFVLDSCRRWHHQGVIAVMTSQPCLDQCSRLYGDEFGQYVLNVVTEFIRTLDAYALARICMRPVGCFHLTRDEVLILGLLSGLQHGDETAITLCLDGLRCPERCDAVLTAAESLVTTLHALDNTLLPIPARTIKAILVEDLSTATIH